MVLGMRADFLDHLGEWLAVEHHALDQLTRPRGGARGVASRMLECEGSEGEAVTAAPGLPSRVVEGK